MLKYIHSRRRTGTDVHLIILIVVAIYSIEREYAI